MSRLGASIGFRQAARLLTGDGGAGAGDVSLKRPLAPPKPRARKPHGQAESREYQPRPPERTAQIKPVKSGGRDVHRLELGNELQLTLSAAGCKRSCRAS